MRELAIVLVPFLIMALVVGAVGCDGEGTSNVTPTPTLKPKASDIARKYGEVLDEYYYIEKWGQTMQDFYEDFMDGLFSPLNILAGITGVDDYASAATLVQEVYGVVQLVDAVNCTELLFPPWQEYQLFKEGFGELADLIDRGEDFSNKRAQLDSALDRLEDYIDAYPSEYLQGGEVKSQNAKDYARKLVQSASYFLNGLAEGLPSEPTPTPTETPTPLPITDGKTVSEAWSIRYSVPGTYGAGPTSIVVDALGNVYVTGMSCLGGTDYWDCEWAFATIKYDNVGKQLWIAYHEASEFGEKCIGTDIAVDDEGNVYVTGCDGSICSHYTIIKYDSDGNQIWLDRREGNGGYLALGPYGEVYVELDEDSLIRYNEDGVEVWAVPVGDITADIFVDGWGNIYVTGTEFTAKYDSDGNRIWVATQIFRADSMAVDTRGNVYVTYADEDTYWTVKYDSDGNEVWTARYDGAKNVPSKRNAIAVDRSGSVYVTGLAGTVKYDSHGNEVWVVGSEGKDIVVDQLDNIYISTLTSVVKYDKVGNKIWQADYGGSSCSDMGTYLSLDGVGNVYVTGLYTTGCTPPVAYLTTKYVQR